MKTEQKEDVVEIDLREVAEVLLRKWWLIAIVTIVFGASAFLVSKFLITPTYESETRIVILSRQNDSDTLTYNDLQMGSQLTKDYVELILSRFVIEQVISDFGLDITYEGMVSKIEVETPSGTRIINITVTDTDPMLAKELADAIRSVAAIHIKEVMDIEAVNIVDEGNIPTEPSGPSVKKWTLIGMAAGFLCTAGLLIIRYLLDDTIQTSEDIERYLNLSTLALIPYQQEEDKGKSKLKTKKKRHKEDSLEELSHLKEIAPLMKEAEIEVEESFEEELVIVDLAEDDPGSAV